MTLKIIAFNINTGGAKVLLDIVTNRINEKKIETVIFVRNMTVLEGNITLYKYIHFKIIKNNLLGFFFLIRKQNNALFLGNLPPFLKSTNSVLYIHSEYLTLSINEIVSQNIPFIDKLKLIFQIASINLFHKNVTQIAVQTQHMADKFKAKLNREILILPFYEERIWQASTIQKEFDFCFVGLPSNHKNHENLISAVRLLLKQNMQFTIALTIPNNKKNCFLISEIEDINRLYPKSIHNFGLVEKQIIDKIYSKSKALIFPSKKESLGLPIIEALQHNLKIISSDKEFSYEIINNPITFNPDNINEIQNSMKDFLEGKFNHIEQSLKIKSEVDTIIKLISNES